MDEVGNCDCCKKRDLLTNYRGWFLCWECFEKLLKNLDIQP